VTGIVRRRSGEENQSLVPASSARLRPGIVSSAMALLDSLDVVGSFELLGASIRLIAALLGYTFDNGIRLEDLFRCNPSSHHHLLGHLSNHTHELLLNKTREARAVYTMVQARLSVRLQASPSVLATRSTELEHFVTQPRCKF
jgi:hypothetical protein